MKYAVNPKIHKWLLSQPWIGQFIDNLINEGYEPKDMLSILLGKDGCNTIDFAFCWENTPEGGNFWSNIDLELRYLWENNEWGESYVYIEI